MKTLIQKVTEATKKTSQAKIAKKLGYKSQGTIQHWIAMGKVPDRAKERVERFFR